MKKFLLVILCLLSVCLLVSCTKDDPSDGLIVRELSKKEMKKDLDYLYEELIVRHTNVYHKITINDFQDEYNLIKSNIDDYSSEEFAFQLMKFVAKISDSATRLYLPNNRIDNRYEFPFSLKVFNNNEIRLFSVLSDHKSYLGSIVKKINGIDINDVIDTLKTYFGNDTDLGKTAMALSYISSYDYLFNAKIATSKQISLTFASATGESEITLDAYKYSDSSRMSIDTLQSSLYTKYQNKYYFYSLEDRILYIQLNRLYEDSNYKIEKLLSDINLYLDTNVFKNVVIDLRYNSTTGSTTFLNPLNEKLKEFTNNSGKLFVLIGSNTGMQAIPYALTLQTICKAILYGEATTGTINRYGNTSYFTLPNSNITVNYPTSYYQFNEKSSVNESLLPNVTVYQNYNDYKNGYDTVINKILNN